MTTGIEKKSIQERYEHLFTVISGERFLKKQGFGTEIPFFIFWYKPEEAVEVERIQRLLSKRLEKNGIRILEINLYDLSIELLKGRGVWDQMLAMEESVTKDQLKELLQGTLDPESHLVRAISARMESAEFDVMFLGGIGEVFPYIRSHNVLNNLHKVAKDKPTVIFYPGEYKHSPDALDLFGKLHEDNYYRAFDIYHYEA